MTGNLCVKISRLVPSLWHPGFGLSEKNICLECDFIDNNHNIEFSWSLTEMHTTDNFPLKVTVLPAYNITRMGKARA